MSVALEPAVQPTAPDTGRRLPRRLVIAAAVSTVLAAGVYLLLVHTALGQRFDNAALLGARAQGTSTRVADISGLQRITADSFAVVLAILVGLGVIRRRPRLGIGVALAAAIAVIGTDFLRKTVLDRPALVGSDASFPLNTFPSGHTATAIACALALVVVSPPAWRGVSAVLAGSYAWFTAAAVQTAGWHRPSDAIGASLLGFAAVAVVAAIIAAWRPIGSGRRIAHYPALAVLGVVWLVAGAVSTLNGVRVLRYLGRHSDSLGTTPAIRDDAYHFSINLTIVVVVSLLAALLVLLGRSDLDEPAR
ncbi:MAG TPA: phosphatase PAP2 family protein [Mycobacteriales bacterium]|nr:phosphatase PAP2 family protein [Mycobacteriales bacterium]